MLTLSSSKHVALVQNLPDKITTPEIRAFFSSVHLVTDNCIQIIFAIKKTAKKQQEGPKAYVIFPSETVLRLAIDRLNGKFIDQKHPVKISVSNRKEMDRELNLMRKLLYNENLTLTCEWIDCDKKFNDRSLYLSHVHRMHGSSFDPNDAGKKICQWQGCFDDCPFVSADHFRLHLSFHAYHNHLMNLGQRMMDMTIPKPVCYNDDSVRNVLTDLSIQALVCGWKDCNGEFFDAETFFDHVGFHAIEDVSIPMMSKEKLKKIRYAKCQWLKCQATFKKKSHLKVHLNSHTQQKIVACPNCGVMFSSRIGFLNHCFRQETPTNVDKNGSMMQTADTFAGDPDDEPEGILTIDEDANPNSIVIHLPGNLQNIIHPQEPSSLDRSKSAANQNVALYVNFDSSHTADGNITDAGNGDHPPGPDTPNNVIQLQLAPANGPSNQMVRENQCTKCSKSFHTAALLREHQMNHALKKCPHCPFSTGYRARLREHILFRHTDSYAFQCTFCQLKFKTRRNLQKHIELHKSAKKKCDLCQQTFTSFYQLNRHVRMQHLKEEIIFACHLCSKHYNRGNNLSRHLIKTHGLKVADGWSRFTYDKRQQDGIYSINPDSCCRP